MLEVFPTVSRHTGSTTGELALRPISDCNGDEIKAEEATVSTKARSYMHGYARLKK